MKRAARQLLLLLLAAALAAPLARAEQPGRSAVLLYISSGTSADLVVPVHEVRTHATAALHELFEASGQQILPAADMDRAVGRWRVRGDWALSRDFLAGLNQESGVALLHVAHLHAGGGSLSLIVRTVTCPDGRLVGVQMPAVAVDPGRDDPDPAVPAAWLDALTALCRSVDPLSFSASAGETMLVLPARGIGCEDSQTLTATACLLQTLLAEGRWSLPDPGLVATTLIQEGVSPTAIGKRGRQLLQKEFACDAMLCLTLAAYGESSPGAAAAFFDDTPATAGIGSLGDFDLALRRIDLAHGVITAGQNVFAPAKVVEGWFGVIRKPALQDRIGNAAANLWLDLSKASEDH